MPLTLGDIRTQIAAYTRLDTDASNNLSLIDRAINDTIQDIHGRYDWYWSIDREIVQTVADKTAGTVSVTSGAQTVTGSSTSFASADVGKYIQFSSSNDWYKITAVASSTSLTIEKPYTGTSDLSAGTYTIRQWTYNLSSSAEKIMDMRQVVGPQRLVMVTSREFDSMRPHPTGTGNASAYFVWGADSSNRIVFFVYPFADAVYNIEIRIKKTATELSTSTDEPQVPAKWRHVIVDGATYRCMRSINPSESVLESVRVQRSIYEEGIAQMLREADPDSDYHPIIKNRESRTDVLSLVRFPQKYEIG